MAVRVAHLVRSVLDDAGLDGFGQDERCEGPARVRADRRPRGHGRGGRRPCARSRRGSSGSIPEIATTAFMKEDRGGKVFVDATRVGGATVVAAYSPRVRPGTPVSFPVDWADLDDVTPGRLHDPHRAGPPR